MEKRGDSLLARMVVAQRAWPGSDSSNDSGSGSVDGSGPKARPKEQKIRIKMS